MALVLIVKHKFDRLEYKSVVVVTTFVASTTQGVHTTLKRSGSDYSATILAMVMGYTAEPQTRARSVFNPLAQVQRGHVVSLLRRPSHRPLGHGAVH
jgi:hypothetical protein